MVVKNGYIISFWSNCLKSLHLNSSKFNIKHIRDLYYLHSISKIVFYNVDRWHKILGHCNKKDVIKLLEKVDGMKITKHKIVLKMIEYENKTPQYKMSKILDLVHRDLLGTVKKRGHQYVPNFVGNFSDLIRLRFFF